MKLERPHRRYNPLTGDYVLVSPQRATRPWQGKVERPPAVEKPRYDPDCYLCPGNRRVNQAINPDYEDIYVFANDFPALLKDAPTEVEKADPLLAVSPARGENRVVCFSPRHDLTLAGMPVEAIAKVVWAWIGQYEELGAEYRWVQVFQNQGEMMGASNPHPHGQIWAIDALPNEAREEDRHQRVYFDDYGRPLLLDYLKRELKEKERLICQNEGWVALVPFWAVWPFETLLLPRRAVPQMPQLTEDEIESLAAILKELLETYDRLFDVPFPYSMGWHGAPFDTDDHAHWQLHAHFYPPLLRSATVRKFMVGYEMLAEAQRDLTPEQAAKRLLAVRA